MYPMLRFDTRLPLRPWHAWQHIYIWVAYPFMHLAFQMGDFNALLTGRTVGAELLGASWGGVCAGRGGGGAVGCVESFCYCAGSERGRGIVEVRGEVRGREQVVWGWGGGGQLSV